MKKIIPFMIAVCIITVLSVTCQKDNEKQVKKSETTEIKIMTPFEDDQDFINRILLFVDKLERFKSGAVLKNDEKMTVSTAVEQIESALNIMHCFPDAEITFTSMCNQQVVIPKDVAGEMDISTIADFNETIKDVVRGQLTNSGFAESKLMLVALVVNEANDSLLVKSLVGNTGVTSLPYKNYKYGDLMGACDNTFIGETDAAKRIEDLVRNYFISLRPTPPTNCRYVYVSPRTTMIDDPWNPIYQLNNPPVNYLDFKIFFASDYFDLEPDGNLDEFVICLDYNDEMLFYKDHYISLLKGFETQQNRLFSGCIFTGMEYSYQPGGVGPSFYSVMHKLEFTVARRILECSAIGPSELSPL